MTLNEMYQKFTNTNYLEEQLKSSPTDDQKYLFHCGVFFWILGILLPLIAWCRSDVLESNVSAFVDAGIAMWMLAALLILTYLIFACWDRIVWIISLFHLHPASHILIDGIERKYPTGPTVVIMLTTLMIVNLSYGLGLLFSDSLTSNGIFLIDYLVLILDVMGMPMLILLICQALLIFLCMQRRPAKKVVE